VIGEPAEVSYSQADGRFRLLLLAATLLAGLLAAAIFAGFPRLDLFVSGLFYSAERGFLLKDEVAAEAIRAILDLLFWAVCIASVAGILFCAVFRKPLLGQGLTQWIFLAALLVIGPGLVANTLLKDNWGRARPDDVVEFGGAKTFTPVLVRADQCTRNCSFVAGEVASIFAAVLGLAMLMERRRRVMLAAAFGLGAVAGLVRIAQGGHFASDVVFAGVFMVLVAVVVHWIVFSLGARLRSDLRPGGALQ
jgi:lipid A 4'-phosphatase